MFDHMSRYSGLDVASYTFEDGRTVSYARRRFLPDGEKLPLLAEAVVAPGERIDAFSHRTLGDPQAYWRICDANNAMDPHTLATQASAKQGKRLRVPLPGAPGDP